MDNLVFCASKYKTSMIVIEATKTLDRRSLNQKSIVLRQIENFNCNFALEMLKIERSLFESKLKAKITRIVVKINRNAKTRF